MKNVLVRVALLLYRAWEIEGKSERSLGVPCKYYVMARLAKGDFIVRYGRTGLGREYTEVCVGERRWVVLMHNSVGTAFVYYDMTSRNKKVFARLEELMGEMSRFATDGKYYGEVYERTPAEYGTVW